MSRKRKRYRGQNGQKKTTPSGPTKPEAVAAILSALDGYSNAAAFLGEDLGGIWTPFPVLDAQPPGSILDPRDCPQW